MAVPERHTRVRDPFLEEVHSSMVLLRQHSFLRYQKNNREYESKRRAAIDGILHAVARKTGVSLTPVYDAIAVEDLREASVVGVRRLLKAAVGTMKRALSTPGAGLAPGGLAAAVREWEKALDRL
jgi:hypothetical protein